MNVRDLSIKDFTYDLPQDRIALHPLPERDLSKLLIYQEGRITSDIYRNLYQYIPSHSQIIFNDTKVIAARLLFQKPTGGVIEIFCLEPHSSAKDLHTAMYAKKQVQWHCLVGGASKWKHGQVLEKTLSINNHDFIFKARFVDRQHGTYVIEFSWTIEISFAEILNIAGNVPLPPYIKRQVEENDKERYQTIYAHHEGSVAAPTAGLHFTDALINTLLAKNITTDFVTLHVGAGTFQPVKAQKMELHQMHGELIHIKRATIDNIIGHLPGKTIAVGTTTLRALESLFWAGVKIRTGAGQPFSISQWEPYDIPQHSIDVREAMTAILDNMTATNRDYVEIRSQLLIAPSYKIKMVDAIITNFHQPESTLLLLIAALIGEDWKSVYRYALQNNFRFLSYGDGCLLWIKDIMQVQEKV